MTCPDLNGSPIILRQQNTSLWFIWNSGAEREISRHVGTCVSGFLMPFPLNSIYICSFTFNLSHPTVFSIQTRSQSINVNSEGFKTKSVGIDFFSKSQNFGRRFCAITTVVFSYRFKVNDLPRATSAEPASVPAGTVCQLLYHEELDPSVGPASELPVRASICRNRRKSVSLGSALCVDDAAHVCLSFDVISVVGARWRWVPILRSRTSPPTSLLFMGLCRLQWNYSEACGLNEVLGFTKTDFRFGSECGGGGGAAVLH